MCHEVILRLFLLMETYNNIDPPSSLSLNDAAYSIFPP
jgi:hypothetical protein